MSRRERHEAREADHLAALFEAGEVAISEVDGLPVVDGRRLCLACRLPIEGDPSKLYHDACADEPEVFQGLRKRLAEAPKRREL
jgi:hypothetical protein